MESHCNSSLDGFMIAQSKCLGKGILLKMQNWIAQVEVVLEFLEKKNIRDPNPLICLSFIIFKSYKPDLSLSPLIIFKSLSREFCLPLDSIALTFLYWLKSSLSCHCETCLDSLWRRQLQSSRWLGWGHKIPFTNSAELLLLHLFS